MIVLFSIIILIYISFFKAAIITVDNIFPLESCNVTLKCPNLRSAIQITHSNDIIELIPGNYSGRDNLLICGNSDFCNFRNVTLRGLGRPDQIVIDANSTVITRAMYVYNHTFAVIQNITFTGIRNSTPFSNYMLPTFSEGSSLFAGGSALAISFTTLQLSNVIFSSNVGLIGAALRIYRSNVLFTNCQFIDNHADSFGGAFYSEISNLTIVDSSFQNNSATSSTASFAASGGAIFYDGATAHFFRAENCRFLGNIAQQFGGAIVAQPNPLNAGPESFIITNSIFDGNVVNGLGACQTLPTCSAAGGAIYATSNLITLENSNFTGNAALAQSAKLSYGGAIYATNKFYDILKDDLFAIFGCRFEKNHANGNGGALYFEGLKVNITDSVFIENYVSAVSPAFPTLPTFGGAVYQTGGPGVLLVANSRFERNQGISSWGGAIYLLSVNVTLINSFFHRNKAFSSYIYPAFGGAIGIAANSFLVAKNCIFLENEAMFLPIYKAASTMSGNGGAIYILGSHLFLSLSNFTRNRAMVGQFDGGSYGGAIVIEASEDVQIIHCFFEKNAAVGYLGYSVFASAGNGGAISLQYSAGRIFGCDFTENWVSAGGAKSSLGGAIIVHSTFGSAGYLTTILISETNFTENGAFNLLCGQELSGKGGAIDLVEVSHGVVNMYRVFFKSNLAYSSRQSSPSAGGAIAITYGSNFSCFECVFDGNNAVNGIGYDLFSSTAPTGSQNHIYLEGCQFTNDVNKLVRSMRISSLAHSLCSSISSNEHYWHLKGSRESPATYGRRRLQKSGGLPAVEVSGVQISGGTARLLNSTVDNPYYSIFLGENSGEVNSGCEATILGVQNGQYLSITAYSSSLLLGQPEGFQSVVNCLNLLYSNLTLVFDLTVQNKSYLYFAQLTGQSNASASAFPVFHLIYNGPLIAGISPAEQINLVAFSHSSNPHPRLNFSGNSSTESLTFHHLDLVINGSMKVDSPFSSIQDKNLSKASFTIFLVFNNQAALTVLGTLTLVRDTIIEGPVRNFGNISLAGQSTSWINQHGLIVGHSQDIASLGSLTSVLYLTGPFSQSSDARLVIYLNHSFQNLPVLFIQENNSQLMQQGHSGTISINFYTDNFVLCPDLQYYDEVTPSSFLVVEYLNETKESIGRVNSSSNSSFTYRYPPGLDFISQQVYDEANNSTSEKIVIESIGCSYIFDYYTQVQSSVSAGSAYPCHICLSNSSCEYCADSSCAVKGQCLAGARYSSTCCDYDCGTYGSCEANADYSSFSCVCSGFFYTGENCRQLTISAIIMILVGAFSGVLFLIFFYQHRHFFWGIRSMVREELERKDPSFDEERGFLLLSSTEGPSILIERWEKDEENLGSINDRNILILTVLEEDRFGSLSRIQYQDSTHQNDYPQYQMKKLPLKVNRSQFIRFEQLVVSSVKVEFTHSHLLPIRGMSFLQHDSRTNKSSSSSISIAENDPHHSIGRGTRTSQGLRASRGKACIGLIYDDLALPTLADWLYRRGSAPSLPYSTLIDIALQISQTLLFLHQKSPPRVHGHLTSAMILVDSKQGKVFVNDAASNYCCSLLAEIIASSESSSTFKGRVLGISKSRTPSVHLEMVTAAHPHHITAWTAPELMTRFSASVGSLQYSMKVDVYSFGLLLWELYERKPPFEEFSTATAAEVNKMMTAIKEEGRRPVISDDCPAFLRSLMMNCWEADPTHRPSMISITRRLLDEKLQIQRSLLPAAQSQQKAEE